MSNRIVLTVSSELFEEANQEVSVKPNVTIGQLITSAIEEFRLSQGEYGVYEQGSNKKLTGEGTFEAQEIQTGAVLVLRREKQQFLTRAIAVVSRTDRKPLTSAQMPFVREVETKTVFRLRWHPAIIGRPDQNNPESKKLLAVDLEPFPNGMSVSRSHASITEEHGAYYLEALSPRNPTFLNDKQLTVGEKYPIRHEDLIRVGKMILQFHLPETQEIKMPKT
jgi:hypothetical protein